MKGRKQAPPAPSVATFPGYEEVEELATGAFASVYKAVELRTGRSVALKVLRVADSSPHLVEVFQKELGALALLSNHPNVTTLYGTFSTPDGRPVLVLELCRESLAQRVRQSGPLSASEVVQVGIKIAGALETAHRSGLLHRDMKPQNILVSQFDEPVLADFGVATLQAQAQSTEGVFGFTTLHAPPEALEGLPLSPSADIYGLASSMYQLLVGRGPFSSYEGEAPASVILRILRDPAPRAPATAVPVALADLMENALAKEPGKRPQSAGAFAEALREIEALAGWPQTPYVVWGAAPAGALPALPTPAAAVTLDVPEVALAPGAAATAVAPVVPVSPGSLPAQPPSPVLPARAAPPTALQQPAPPAPPAPPARRKRTARRPAAPPERAVPDLSAPPPPERAVPDLSAPPPPERAVPDLSAPPPPARASEELPSPPPPVPSLMADKPPPPGTRSVIAPPPQERTVLTPVAANVRVLAATPPTPIAPAPLGPVAPSFGPNPSAAAGRWPLLPGVRVSPGISHPSAALLRSDSLHPLGLTGAFGPLSPSTPRAPASQAVARTRKSRPVIVLAFLGAAVLIGGLVWAAVGHLL